MSETDTANVPAVPPPVSREPRHAWVVTLGAAALVVTIGAAVDPSASRTPPEPRVMSLREPEAAAPDSAQRNANPDDSVSPRGPNTAPRNSTPPTASVQQAAQGQSQGQGDAPPPATTTSPEVASAGTGVPVREPEVIDEAAATTAATDDEQRRALDSLAGTVQRIIARAEATRTATAPDAYVQAAGLLRDAIQVATTRQAEFGDMPEFAALVRTVHAALDSTITVCRREAALMRRRGQAPECPQGGN